MIDFHQLAGYKTFVKFTAKLAEDPKRDAKLRLLNKLGLNPPWVHDSLGDRDVRPWALEYPLEPQITASTVPSRPETPVPPPEFMLPTRREYTGRYIVAC